MPDHRHINKVIIVIVIITIIIIIIIIIEDPRFWMSARGRKFSGEQ